MKRLNSVITVVTIIFIGFSANFSRSETASGSNIPDELIARKLKQHDPSLAIAVDTVFYKLRHNHKLTLVDVRSQQQFERLHIPGSVNIPLPLIQQALKRLDRQTPVLLYCNSGQRSGMAKQLLEACGFMVVHNLGSYTCLDFGK